MFFHTKTNVPHVLNFLSFTNDHGYVPHVVSTSLSFPHLWLFNRFVFRVQRRVPLEEQELLTFLEHLSSLPVFSGVCVAIFFVFVYCFADRCLSFFNHLYVFFLSLLYCSISNKSHVQTRLLSSFASIRCFIIHNSSQKPLKNCLTMPLMFYLLFLK